MSIEKTKFVVGGVPEHFNLPLHQAIESGAFDKVGIDLEYQEVGGGTGAMMKGLESSELDIAIVLTEGGVASILKGNPSRIVKTYVQSPLIWGIHVPAQSDIETVDDIQGKRYAISRFGSGSHLMAIVDASERGWETENLRFEKVGNLSGAREALANGNAENFLWEKYTTSPYVESGEFRLVGIRKTLWPAFVVCVREETLAQHGEKIKAMLEVVNQACADLMDADNACETIAQRYELPVALVQEWFDQTQWSTDFEKPAAALDSVSMYLKKLEIVTGEQADSGDVWYEF